MQAAVFYTVLILGRSGIMYLKQHMIGHKYHTPLSSMTRMKTSIPPCHQIEECPFLHPFIPPSFPLSHLSSFPPFFTQTIPILAAPTTDCEEFCSTAHLYSSLLIYTTVSFPFPPFLPRSLFPAGYSGKSANMCSCVVYGSL